MSNKTKQQQQQQHHQHQQQQQQQQQQHHHHQHHQHHQLHHLHHHHQLQHHQQALKEGLPPRYQPPPQPQTTSGILKPQASYPSNVVNNGAAVAAAGAASNSGIVTQAATSQAGLSHLQIQHQLQLQHQQQAARLASQVKDAVQSKFAQKIDLPSSVNSAGIQHNSVGSSAGSATSTTSSGQQSTRADKLTTGYGIHGKSYIPTSIPQQQQQQQQPSQVSGISTPTALGPASTAAVSAITAASSAATVGLPNVNGISQLPTGLNGQVAGVGAATPRQRISDDEFLRLGPVEMLKFVRKTESDIARLAAEQHRQIQNLVTELRALKEANQRLSNDNQELRDLCCFLDDDRQKGRKLAREWQRFGRYTASVMRQEVEAYQNKLRQLDNKQQELIKDNLELKELCLYLDEERGGGQRDDGDGSSSSTNADESAPAPARVARHAMSTFNDQTMQYVRSLEQRVKQLEEDKSILQARAQNWLNVPAPPPPPPPLPQKTDLWDPGNTHNMPSNDDFHLTGRPEAVVRALQVLEVREKLEREAGHDGEKALVREMCNVVWRKLEEGPQQNRH